MREIERQREMRDKERQRETKRQREIERQREMREIERDIMNRDQAEGRALELKRSGMTVGEVYEVMLCEGWWNDNTSRGYGMYTLRQWCRGVSDQRGYRNPPRSDLSEGERKVRHLEQMRLWRLRNKAHCRAYDAWYRREFKNKG